MAAYISNRKLTEIIPEKANNPAFWVLDNDNAVKASGFLLILNDLF
jgi:hypothetical protein